MNWGWHYRYDNKGCPHKVGMWLFGEPYNHRIYIPLPMKLFVR